MEETFEDMDDEELVDEANEEVEKVKVLNTPSQLQFCTIFHFY
jgi:hypothetical protein